VGREGRKESERGRNKRGEIETDRRIVKGREVKVRGRLPLSIAWNFQSNHPHGANGERRKEMREIDVLNMAPMLLMQTFRCYLILLIRAENVDKGRKPGIF
jgi:hypothetical protein